MEITNAVIWWEKQGVKQLVKKLNPGDNIPGRKLFSVLLCNNILQLQSYMVIKLL